MSKNKKIEGSQKHILDWTESPEFVTELNGLVKDYNISIADKSTLRPNGYGSKKEYQLVKYLKEHLSQFSNLNEDKINELEHWWTVHGGKTPTWDLLTLCKINNETGILLVEAKAHVSELKSKGKKLSNKANDKKNENHDCIKRNINECCIDLNTDVAGFNISIDTHYQLSNRITWSWKLNKLGIPVALMYLGFIGDTYFEDYFKDESDWNRQILGYMNNIVPEPFIVTNKYFPFIIKSLSTKTNVL